MQLSLQYAAEHFADIVAAVDRGELVEIERPGKPAVKLVVGNMPAAAAQPGKRVLGTGVGRMDVPSWEEWAAMDEEVEREMLAELSSPSVEQ